MSQPTDPHLSGFPSSYHLYAVANSRKEERKKAVERKTKDKSAKGGMRGDGSILSPATSM